MVNDLVIILLCVIALMFITDYSRRPPKIREKVMDDDEDSA
jgi:hypothetical protein